jgi:hypothetical protein
MYFKDGTMYAGNWRNSRMEGYGLRTYKTTTNFKMYQGSILQNSTSAKKSKISECNR